MARPNLIHNITDDSVLGGSVIEASLRFNNNDDTRLVRTIGSTSNRRTYTYSWWMKRTVKSAEQYIWYNGHASSTPYLDARFEANNHQLQISDYTGGSSRPIRFITNRQFRDASGWYHFVFAVDTTQGTASNRAKLYVNGVQETSFSTETYPSQNYDSSANVSGNLQVWGTNKVSSSNDLDCYLAEAHFVDGQQLTPSSFGYTDFQTGIWRPKRYTGSHGTNGFYLPLNGSSHIGRDQSGNGNDFLPSNLTGTVPIQKATGGFPILNTNSAGTIVKTGQRPDPFASNIVLALPLSDSSSVVGTDVHHLIKGSGSAKTLTNNGSIVSNTTIDKSNFYGRSGSVYLNNASSQNIAISTSDDFNFGTGDLTVECWVYPTTNGAADGSLFVTHNGSTYFAFNFDPGTRFNLYTNSGGATQLNNGIDRIKYSDWNHVALVRQSGVFTLYVNGLATDTHNFSGQIGYNGSDTTICRIGGGASSSVNSYMQDLRIYKGVAKYTDDFLCPSSKPDIVKESPSGIPHSRKNDPIIGASTGFKTASNSMVLASNSDLYLDGDFTIEFWIYLHSIAVETHNPSPITFPDNSGRGQVYINASNKFYSLWWPSTDIVKTSNNSAQTGKWQYVTVTRSSNSCRIFLDGILHQTATSSQAFGNAYGGFTIGGYTSTTGNVNGHISNLRIIKGTALYTSTFTPPTAPLTNVTNTKLLCYQSPTDVEALTVDPNSSGLNNKNWTRSGTFAWSIGADSSVNNKGRLFDGDISTGSPGAPAGNPGNVRFTFDTPITGITKCRLRTNTHNDSWQYRRVYYNGANGTNSIQTASNTTAWHDVTSNVGNTLNWVEWGSYGGGDGDRTPYGCNGIEINDVLLTDKFRDDDGHGATCNASDFSPFDSTDFNESSSNYATLNALHGFSYNTTFADGNLFANIPASNTYGKAFGDMPIKSGKWYYEVYYDQAGGNGDYLYVGLGDIDKGSLFYRSVRGSDGEQVPNNGGTEVRFTTGDLINVAVDLDNGKWYIGRNGTYWYSGNPVAGTGYVHNDLLTGVSTYGGLVPLFYNATSGAAQQFSVNFGQKPFQFTPPSGFLAIASHNLEPSQILNPNKHFDTVIYNGPGSGTQDITSLEFQPDFVWIKGRSSGWNVLVDSVRGVGKILASNETAVENNSSDSQTAFQAFLPNGFRVGHNASWYVNGGSGSSSQSQVAWCWKAGGASVTNNDGTKSVTLSANPEAGFSIIEWSGSDANATCGHGLGKKPKWFIVKSRTHSQNWFVYHVGTGATKNPRLNDNAAPYTTANIWNNTEPTDTVISLGSSSGVNGNGNSYICYCWTDIPGYSKFGSYTGNGNNDGPFVYTGFKVEFLLIKRTNTTEHWILADTKRNSVSGRESPADSYLLASASNAESTGIVYDMLSNGFKFRSTSQNESGSTYIYMAFAEQPKITPFGSQSNAR